MAKAPRQSSGELRSIADMWEIYRERVVPRDAPPVQVSECRRAFYAGAQGVLMDGFMGIGDKSISEDDGIAHLEKLHQECNDFAAKVAAGRA
jgi:hypothetical protein